jgi:hypothetical protein
MSAALITDVVLAISKERNAATHAEAVDGHFQPVP